MPELHAPPAGLEDLQRIPDGLRHWDAYVGACIDDSIQLLGLPAESRQFVNRMPAPPVLELPIFWNAFPKGLLARYGRERALVMADELQLFKEGWARPQNEYCEWQVQRHPTSHRIQRITFTAETSEYWQVMFGGDVDKPAQPKMTFAGDPQQVARRYRQWVRAGLRPSDLCGTNGAYDPRNCWNTTDGIVHMSHPDNTLPAAIKLIADGTLLFERNRSPITFPEALCCAVGKVDPSRASDLTVVGTVNALARQGARLALAEPFGIYIHHVDTKGWVLPGLQDAQACCRIERGHPGQALRLVVEAPPGSTSQLHDLKLGGEPLTHGGQVAECITMRTSILVSLAEPVAKAARVPSLQGFLLASNLALLDRMSVGGPSLSGRIPAFTHP